MANSPKHTDLTDKEPGGIIDHADASIPAAKLRHPFSFEEFPYTPPGFPYEHYHAANKRFVDYYVDDATPTYVGLTPRYHRLTAADTWEPWDLSLYVPGKARFVEILHRNPTPFTMCLAGSRKPGSDIDRTFNLPPQSVFTWTTELSPGRVVELFSHFRLAVIWLVGYWT